MTIPGFEADLINLRLDNVLLQAAYRIRDLPSRNGQTGLLLNRRSNLASLAARENQLSPGYA